MTRRIASQSKKKTRLEQLAQNKELKAYHQAGKGWYRFRNRNENSTLDLPKPGKVGTAYTTKIGPVLKNVPGSGEWEGDDYFMQMVKSHLAIFVKEIRSPVEQENYMNEQKLLMDQPDKFTQAGKVEQVMVKPDPKPLNETTPQSQKKEEDMLINEDPMDGVQIIMG